MVINKPARPNKSYWRWRKRFAFFPVRMSDTKQLVWLEFYYWRYVFDFFVPIRAITRSKLPIPEYTDERVNMEGVAQLVGRTARTSRFPGAKNG